MRVALSGARQKVRNGLNARSHRAYRRNESGVADVVKSRPVLAPGVHEDRENGAHSAKITVTMEHLR